MLDRRNYREHAACTADEVATNPKQVYEYISSP